MSVLDQFGDDRRPILEVALEQPTPNRISKAWVCHRIAKAFDETALFLLTDTSAALEAIFRRYGFV